MYVTRSGYLREEKPDRDAEPVLHGDPATREELLLRLNLRCCRCSRPTTDLDRVPEPKHPNLVAHVTCQGPA